VKDFMAYPQQRQAEILKRLGETGSVKCAPLSSELGVSEHTIRRDLKELADKGLCKRIHGGAVRFAPVAETLATRLEGNQQQKRALSSIAVTLMRAGSCLFLDAGSTNVEIARQLPEELDLTVVTNSPLIALEAEKKKGCQVILIGGAFNGETGGCLGITAINQIKQIHFDQVYLGACAFDVEEGITAFNYEDAEFKRGVIERSGELIVALAAEKIATVARYLIVSPEKISTLIIDSASPEIITACRNKGVDVVSRPPDNSSAVSS